MKYHLIAKTFKDKGIDLFTTKEFEQITGLSQKSAWAALGRYCQKGLIENPKRGLYFFADNPPHDYLLANRVYSPSYVSFETAMAYYSIIPEVVYAITSATTKITRKFVYKSKSFKYSKIKIQTFTGYYKKEDYLIADPEKALIDYLYFVALGKKALNDRISIVNLDQKKLAEYAKLFENKGLNKLVEEL